MTATATDAKQLLPKRYLRLKVQETRIAERGGDENPFIPVSLHPKQQEFFDYDGLEALFGGAAGGGKTIAQLASALKYVHVPGYSAVLIRRAYTHLEQPGAFIPLSREWLQGRARYNQSTKTWYFPSGARVSFGYLDNARDLDRYQGAEYQFIGIDEATQIPENRLRYLFSRLRKPKSLKVPLRIRLTANPGGVAHEYVKQRYIDQEHPDRIFIPSLLADNPSLDRDEYIRSLMELDPFTRERLMNGDWDVMPDGGMFRRDWFRIIEAHEVPPNINWVRYWDMAATAPEEGKDPDYTAGALVGLHDGVWYVKDMQHFRENAFGNEKRITETAFADGRGVQIYMEEEGGSSGKSVIAHYARRILVGFTFRGHRPTGKKEERAAPVASAAEQGNLCLVRGPWVQRFIDEASAFPMSAHKDQVDAVSGGYAVINDRLSSPVSFRIKDL
jgi:predicted phage terminase large subunit-like protein